MAERQLVKAGDTEFYVEVTGGTRVGTVALTDALSFDGLRDVIAAIGSEIAGAWESSKPQEATVEFGLNVTVRTGRLTGLLVEGGGDATMKVSLTWTRSPA